MVRWFFTILLTIAVAVLVVPVSVLISWLKFSYEVAKGIIGILRGEITEDDLV